MSNALNVHKNFLNCDIFIKTCFGYFLQATDKNIKYTYSHRQRRA